MRSRVLDERIFSIENSITVKTELDNICRSYAIMRVMVQIMGHIKLMSTGIDNMNT